VLQLGAELVKRLRDGLILRRAVLLRGSDLVLGGGSLALHEQLGKVLGLAVGGGPLPVFRLEGGLLLSRSWVLGRRLLLGLTFGVRGARLVDPRCLGDLELLPFDVIFFDVLFLRVELEADDCLDLPNAAFNCE
jgi:hypothetical protein